MDSSLTPEQLLHLKEIELETERKLRKCCGVEFEGRDREIALKEKNLKELTACNIQRIRDGVCCCKQGYSGGCC